VGESDRERESEGEHIDIERVPTHGFIALHATICGSHIDTRL